MTKAQLDRIDQLDGALKSYATVMADSAMEEARQAYPSMARPAHPITPEAPYGPLPDHREPKFQRFTAPFDFSGSPTLSKPCGFNREDLPLSLQFVGRHLSEPLLCQVGHVYEQATDWHKRHPEV